MNIVISPRAEKELKNISKIDQIALAKKIRSLAKEQITNEERLKGYKDIFRVRIGNYRIVYKRIKQQVFIVLIGHRKNIYDLLKRLF